MGRLEHITNYSLTKKPKAMQRLRIVFAILGRVTDVKIPNLPVSGVFAVLQRQQPRRKKPS